MRTLIILLTVSILTMGMFGCNATSGHAINQDLKYLNDDTQRVLGLDQPSALHPRELTAGDAAQPYRGYP